MTRLIVHAGNTKTGTTSLQVFFASNRARLFSHGIACPEPSTEMGNYGRNAMMLRVGLDHISDLERGNGLSDLREVAATNIERLGLFVGACDAVLISDEMLWGWGRDTEFWGKVSQLAEVLGFEGIDVIVYHRRQDLHAVANWREGCGWGEMCLPFEEYIRDTDVLSRLDYAKGCKQIEQGLAEGSRLIVRRYELGRFEGGDIFHDFCAAAGIPWDDDYRTPSRYLNSARSLDDCEAMRRFYEHVDAFIPYNTQVTEVFATASKLATSPSAKGETPFTPQAARQFMEQFHDGNEQVSQRYFAGEPLFSDDYDLPIWIPNEANISKLYEALVNAYKIRDIYR